MEKMTFNIDKDTRKLVDATQDYDVDFHDDKYNWLTARQYENSMRQVEVHVIQGDGTPFDLTGVNPVFEGWLPDSLHRVYDSKHSVILDPQGGVFRFDFPARAFSVAGSYKQAFFRLMRDSDSVATLEFSLDVLADKVISGIVPSDYISPFEDLYEQLQGIINGADGKFDSQITDWKKQVNSTITNLNADYSDIQTTYNAAKATLDSLSEQVKSKGLMTQGDFDDQVKDVKNDINDAMDHLNHTVILGDNLNVGKPVTAEHKSALDNLKSLLDPNQFNMLFITDVHYESQSLDNNLSAGFGLEHINNALYLSDAVDAIVMGGDNINGYYPDNLGLVNDESTIANKFMLNTVGKSDMFALKGNHDDGSLRQLAFRKGDYDNDASVTTMPEVIDNNQFKQDYYNSALLSGEHRNGNSNYFYKDYPDKKVRLIGLDSNDNPTMLADDGGLKYPGIWRMGYRQDQLNWLANIALQNVPEDYVTIICAHIQATTAGYDDNSIDPTHDSHTNQGIVDQIVRDFMNGSSSTLSSSVPDWEANIKTDFTAQGKRNFAGWIHGHEHVENYRTDSGFNDIGSLASLGPAYDDEYFKEYYGNRDGWVIVSLDPVKRSLQFRGFGLANNRQFNY